MFTTLKQRVPSGLILIGLLVLLVFKAPVFILCGASVLIAVLALFEFYRVLDRQDIPCFRFLGALSGTGLIICAWLAQSAPSTPRTPAPELLVLAVILIAVFFRQFPQKLNGHPIATMAGTLLGVLYIPFLLSFFVYLATAGAPLRWTHTIGATGQWLVLYLIAVIKATDSGAYCVGNLCGRHKLIPRISPAKTWEGFFGGLAAGLLTSAIFCAALHQQFGALTLSWGHALALGLLLPLVGTLGDLFESLLKRSAGAKDASRMIPGMGGLLDVLDSLLFGAPVFYIYLRCLVGFPS